MKIFLSFLFIVSISVPSFALDVITSKKIMPDNLASELEVLTGLIIKGKSQTATLSTKRLLDGRTLISLNKVIGSLTDPQRIAVINHIRNSHTGQPTSKQKIRRDVKFPSLKKLAIARLDCDLGSCSDLEAIKTEYSKLKTKYP